MEFKGVIYRGELPVDEALAMRIPEDLLEFYQENNGLIAYNGGLQIRACVQDETPHSLARYWFGERALSKRYPNLLSSDIPFAQDCVGDQFILRDDGVWLLSTETGEVMDMEVSLIEFFENCIADPIEYLAMEPLATHLETEGPLASGMLVHVVPALSLELPDDAVYHLDSLSVDDRLDWLFDFFQENTLA